MKRKDNWTEFRTILKSNKVLKLYHFTDKSNLLSIIENEGLYSWSEIIKKGLSVKRPGGSDISHIIDNKYDYDNYVHLSICKKHPMMYAAINDARIHDPFILEIDPEVIYDVDTVYSDRNTTRRDCKIGSSIKDFNAIHFCSAKSHSVFDLDEEERPFYQAEILVKGFIPKAYILNFQKILKECHIGDDYSTYDDHKTTDSNQNVVDLANEAFIIANDYVSKKQYEKAIEWYQKAATHNNPQAQRELGLINLEGLYGFSTNYEQSLYWLGKAAEQNDSLALFYLGKQHIDGLGIEQDTEYGWGLWKQSVNNPDPNEISLCHVGYAYIKGVYGEKDIDKGLDFIKEAAKKNNPDAQFLLGELIINKEVYGKIFDSPYYWYEKAAENGNVKAQLIVGNHYFNNEDYKDAIRFYKIAYKQKEINAGTKLAICYKKGYGVKTNDAKAFALFNEAAIAGDCEAQVELFEYLIAGKECDKDITVAFDWLVQAADKNYIKAIVKLIGLYLKGELIEYDFTKVEYYLLKLIDLDYLPALHRLAIEYKKIYESADKDIIFNKRLNKYVPVAYYKTQYYDLLNKAADKGHIESICILGRYEQLNTSRRNNRETVLNGVHYCGKHIVNGSKAENNDINEGVRIIVDKAFCSDKVKQITIPSTTVAIGKGAFIGRNINSIISKSPFFEIQGCFLIGKLDNSIITYFGKEKKVVIPDGIEKIGCYAFYNKEIEEICLPTTLKIIDDYAFDFCEKLKNIALPPTIEKLGDYAFEYCSSLTSITFSLSESEQYIKDVPISYSLKEIGDYCFLKSAITTFEIPDSVKQIGCGAFCDCEKLHHIKWPSSTKFIAADMFADCIQLSDFTIPCGINSIGKYAFRNTPINELIIPDSVITIEDCAFLGCDSLKKIYLGKKVEYIGKCAFCGCSSLNELCLPPSIKTIEDYAFIKVKKVSCNNDTFFSDANGLYKRTEEGITLIKYNGGDRYLGSLEVKAFGPGAFIYSTLKEITIPQSVICIGKDCFYGCSNLEQIDLNNNIYEIPDGAFHGCTSLKKLLIPYNINKVGYSAIPGENKNPIMVTIPKIDIEISYSSFSIRSMNYSSWSDVYHHDSNPRVYSDWIEEYKEKPLSISLYLPKGTRLLYDQTMIKNCTVFD